MDHLRADAERRERIFEQLRAIRFVDDLRLRRIEECQIGQGIITPFGADV